MASLSMAFGAATAAAGSGAAAAAGGRRRVHVRATAGNGAGSTTEEKGLLDWILGGLQKQDQLLETDPVLNKVEEKSYGTSRKSSTTSVSVPNKKPGGFGGLFARN